MRRIRVQEKDPATPVTSMLPDVDPALRDASDPDPVVEAMVSRLRSSLDGMVALDEYGRPVPWRTVVRIALGPALNQLSEGAAEEEQQQQQVIVLPADGAEAPAGEVAAAEVPLRASRPGAAGGRHYRPA